MSKTEIIILVPKTNPHKIAQLSDLAGPGLRVGVANPDQSTLGALTRRLLTDAKILDQVTKNVVTQTPTADLLVNQMRAGSLDAVVVYAANISKIRDQFHVVNLRLPQAIAVQTYSIGKQSKYPRLSERLRAALQTPVSRARYHSTGFNSP